ncbi:MAG TPA: hypothetical protein VN923_04645, partial [Thermoanaerobaculia bacterium]|nr:hypothetical protein [Thermoanaerobaculia bacterium]
HLVAAEEQRADAHAVRRPLLGAAVVLPHPELAGWDLDPLLRIEERLDAQLPPPITSRVAFRMEAMNP